MKDGQGTLRLHQPDRRRLVIGIAAGIGATIASLRTHASGLAKAESPAISSTQTSTSLHYEEEYKADPLRIYTLLLDPKQFADLTGLGAQIDAREGAAFSLFGGLIVGRNVELIHGQRIVQAWRPGSWESGVYSIVRFELKPRAAGSTLVLDHTGFPQGLADHLNQGWHAHYLDPLSKLFA